MKTMLKGWDKQFPGRLETIFTALQNVAPSQLLDAKIFDFAGLKLDARPEQDRPCESDAGLEILAY
jgi:tRNA 2-thiocytidine biosynthesis protein TtcA